MARNPVYFDPQIDGDDVLWVCQSCGAELHADCVGDTCLACGAPAGDEPSSEIQDDLAMSGNKIISGLRQAVAHAKSTHEEVVPRDAWTHPIYWAADNARLLFLRDGDANDQMTALSLAVDAAFSEARLPHPTRFPVDILTEAQKVCDSYATENQSFHDRFTAAEAEAAALRAENERLREAIQAYLDGNYDSSRSRRPEKCRHSQPYVEACECCIDEHFQAALNPPAQAATNSGNSDLSQAYIRQSMADEVEVKVAEAGHE